MKDIRSILKFWGKKQYIGCDIGASCVKVVKLEKVDSDIHLVGKGIFSAPDDLDTKERSNRMRAFLQKNNFIPDGMVGVNIEHSTLFIRKMDLPKMPERDMKAAIKWNFREYVEGSVDDYIVDYLPIKGFKVGDKLPISAFCISKKAVEDVVTLLKNSGVNPAFVEPNATALLAAFDYNIKTDMKRFYAILDLGDAVANFIVVSRSCLLFSRPIYNLSGRKMMDLISKNTSLDVEKAVELIKSYVVKKSNEENAVSSLSGEESRIGEAISKFISEMVVEVQRSIDAFCLLYRQENVDKIYLCGGGICLPEIAERFSSGLGVEVELFNPFERISGAETAAKLNTAPMYALAVGLALPRE